MITNDEEAFSTLLGIEKTLDDYTTGLTSITDQNRVPEIELKHAKTLFAQVSVYGRETQNEELASKIEETQIYIEIADEVGAVIGFEEYNINSA
jgi:hypothetical protein